MGRDALTFHLQFSWVHFSCLGPPIELNMNGKGFEDKSKAYRFGELLGTIIAYTIIWVWIKPMNAVKKKLNMTLEQRAEYQNMRQLLLDFIADPMDEEDEAAWKRHLNTYDELLAEVKRLREGIQDALYLFQEAGNPKMSDKKRLDTICDALLEVIE